MHTLYKYVYLYIRNCSLLFDIAFVPHYFSIEKLSCDMFCFVAHIDVVIATKILKELATKEQRHIYIHTYLYIQKIKRTIT